MAVAVVLLAAGAAKLGQPAWPATAAAFGAPPWLARALPWLELGLGGLLAAGVGLPWTTAGAASLVAAFTGAVGMQLARGQAVPCGCFGELSPEPVGPDTLARNAVLVGLAVVAVAAGRRGAEWAEVLAGAGGGLAFVAVARARPGRRR